MTQMLLFDSTTEHAPVLAPAVVPATTTADSAASSADVIDSAAVNPESRKTKRSGDGSNEAGLHHMGDLARLVLLRYDLVAARRARRAAK